MGVVTDPLEDTGVEADMEDIDPKKNSRNGRFVIRQ